MGIDLVEAKKRGMSQDVAERWQERHGPVVGFALRLRIESLIASKPETSHGVHGWIDHWTCEALSVLKETLKDGEGS